MNESGAREKRENPLISLVVNIAVPVFVLMKLSGDGQLGAINALLVALAFPLSYGLYDFILRRNFNFVSGVGFIGILLTGGIGLLKLDVQWIAVKEAGVPLVIGLAVVASMKTRYSPVKALVGKMIDVDRVIAALEEKGRAGGFETRLRRATLIVGGSFFFSAVLNYILARLIVVSPAGTAAFNEELGKMTALSFPVIALPSIALMVGAVFYLLRGVTKETGLDIQSIMR